MDEPDGFAAALREWESTARQRARLIRADDQLQAAGTATFATTSRVLGDPPARRPRGGAGVRPHRQPIPRSRLSDQQRQELGLRIARARRATASSSIWAA